MNTNANRPTLQLYSASFDFFFRFGCSTCLVEGTYNAEFRKMTFPIEEDFELRSVISHQRHQEKGTISSPCFGVKGRTPLSKLLKLPIQVPYDVMHLIYLGVARRLLSVIVEKRLVDVSVLSSSISEIKLPHWFRRRPRTLNELCLWKSQEHKQFLLYFSPFCFCKTFQLQQNYTERQLLILYLCFSTAIYALSTENVSSQTIHFSRTIILFFQKIMKSAFGDRVATGSLHAMCHLPGQVENFGSLNQTSATCFENVNRFLKRSVTAKRGQGKQIGDRFLRMQNSATIPEALTGIKILRYESKQNCIPPLLENFSLSVQACNFISKVRVNENVFHSYSYGKSLKCASYNAYLDREKEFVKIKSIFIHNGEVKCLCRSYETKKHWWQFVDFPRNIANAMSVMNSHFALIKGTLKLYPVMSLSCHAILVKTSHYFYGVRVINDYEHE